MGFDIFNPQVSKVSYDLSGKTMLLYGTNSTGKTCQSVRFPKSLVLAFEAGLDGLGGVRNFPMRRWADFTYFVKTIGKNLDKAREMYQTLIFDETSVMGDMCQQYICEQYGVNRIKDGNDGYGLWKEYADEFKRQLDAITSMGFACIFIAHEGVREFTDENGVKYSKIYPAGDKRIIDPICNLVDIIAYAAINNPDDEGNEVKSSLFLKNTRKYHARSRFPAMVPYLKEFTAENLQKAIHDAVMAQQAVDGVAAVSYEEQKENEIAMPSASYEDLFNSIKDIAIKMNENGQSVQYKEVIERYLGPGCGVQDTTPNQVQVLERILSDLQNCIA